jgi:very-short-patch-repair endonuclease
MRNVRKDAKIKTARRLRKAMTKPEVWLWMKLRNRSGDGLVFRNQHPLGQYVLDFYCPKAKLCIEVDGAVHSQNYRIAKDEIRDAWLADQGISVHRIPAAELLVNTDEAADVIFGLARDRVNSLRRAKEAPPTASRSLRGRKLYFRLAHPINGEGQEK